MQTYPAVVAFHRTLNHDVHHIGFKPLTEVDIKPGQYLEVCLDNGWCVPYSVGNDPTQSQLLELYVQHLPEGDANIRVIEATQEGAEVTLAANGEIFYTPEWDKVPLVLLVAGCGISQARSFIEARLASGSAQPVYLCWGGGDERELFPLEQLTQWSKDKRFMADLTLDRPSDEWTFAKGTVVDTALKGLTWMTPKERSRAKVVVTGSPNMVDATRARLTEAGFAADNLLADQDYYQVRTL